MCDKRLGIYKGVFSPYLAICTGNNCLNEIAPLKKFKSFNKIIVSGFP